MNDVKGMIIQPLKILFEQPLIFKNRHGHTLGHHSYYNTMF